MNRTRLFKIPLIGIWGSLAIMLAPTSLFAIDPPQSGSIRIATFNMALHRKSAGELKRGLVVGDSQAKKLAAIVQWVNPDVLLANEVDYDGPVESPDDASDATELAATTLRTKYLNDETLLKSTRPATWSPWPFQFVAPVNTGVPSGLDLNRNGRTNDPEDAWGYGQFSGQYGMAIYSRYPIAADNARTFQKFLWSAMPGALEPGFGERGTAGWQPYYSPDTWRQLRLSSKSHWDVPIAIGSKTLHILASHPTPPVFDGPEDRNGCRNHDEIRLLQDYVEGAEYLVDDSGMKGGLPSTSSFVILGDLNADPNDGSGNVAAIRALLKSKRIRSNLTPHSFGGAEASQIQKGINAKQVGDPAEDTGDFNDKTTGNLRIDFVLPSSDAIITGGGVFWPTQAELEALEIDIREASDHHLVWLDLQLP